MTVLGNLRSGTFHVLGVAVLVGEVLFDDVVRLHIDLLVGVVLAVVDLLHAAHLLDEESVTVDGLTSLVARLLVHLTHLQDVLKAVEGNLDDLVVRACEQVTQWLDAAHLDEESNLSRSLKAARSGVGYSPASFLSRLEITILEEVNERLDDVCIDDSLDLRRVSSGDVGDGPAGLFPDTILSGAEKGKQGRECAAVNDDLGLNVVTGDNVTNGSKGGCLHGGRGVHQQLHEAPGNTGLYDSLDLVICAIRKI